MHKRINKQLNNPNKNELAVQTYTFLMVRGKDVGILPPIWLLLKSLVHKIEQSFIEITHRDVHKFKQTNASSQRQTVCPPFTMMKIEIETHISMMDPKSAKLSPNCPPKLAPLSFLLMQTNSSEHMA